MRPELGHAGAAEACIQSRQARSTPTTASMAASRACPPLRTIYSRAPCGIVEGSTRHAPMGTATKHTGAAKAYVQRCSARRSLAVRPEEPKVFGQFRADHSDRQLQGGPCIIFFRRSKLKQDVLAQRMRTNSGLCSASLMNAALLEVPGELHDRPLPLRLTI